MRHLPLLLMWLAGPVLAADLSGIVSLDGSNRPASGADISLTCNKHPYSTRSDNFGRYALRGLPAQASCSLGVSYGGKTAIPLVIYLDNGATNANLQLRRWRQQWLINRR